MQTIHNPSHVIIIGNGFDLNLGLKTGYCDFVRSRYFDLLINNDNNLAIYLKKQHDLFNWIDIENELKQYSHIQNIKQHIENYENDFNDLSKALITYLSEIRYENINRNSHSYKLLENVAYEEFLILDFNYTRSTKIILTELGLSERDINNRIIKVHGSLDEGHIIFGVEDNAKINQSHIFLKKAYHSNFKAINVKKQFDSLEELFILGHSLGETDHTYFKHFFLEISMEHTYKSKHIHLYHHGTLGYRQLLTQLDTLTLNSLTTLRSNNRINHIDTSQQLA